MTQAFSFPPAPPAFVNAAESWLLKADSDGTASVTITVPYIEPGNQLDYRMFIEIFDGNDIQVRHGGNVIGLADSAGDTNGSNTALHDGDEITIISEGPCRHVISAFTFDVAAE